MKTDHDKSVIVDLTLLKDKSNIPPHVYGNDSFLKDWTEVSKASDESSVRSANCWEPCWDLPRGWECHLPYDNPKKPCTYLYCPYGIEVLGCKNMFIADQKIRKWKKKYKVHVKCEHCQRTPCCLEEMAELLSDQGEELTSKREIQNDCVRYHLYRTAARLYFGFLGLGNRKELPECIVDFIRSLYPKGYDQDYTDFVENNKFYYAQNY